MLTGIVVVQAPRSCREGAARGGALPPGYHGFARGAVESEKSTQFGFMSLGNRAYHWPLEIIFLQFMF